MTASVVHALVDGVRRDAGRPLVTYYDDATGERVELSWATTVNWVNKTAALLHDELSVSPGEIVAIDLPPHWQGLVAALATWAVGGVVGDNPTCADHVIRAVGGSGAARASAPLVLGLHPLGRPGAGEPGTVDYDREVLAYPDAGPGIPPPGSSALAIQVQGVSMSHGDVVDAGRRHAENTRTAGARLIYTEPPSSRRGLIDVVAAPIISGGSIVLCRNLDAAALATRVAQEQAQLAPAASDGSRK